jgi:3-oxoacyl-[acyl-carrier protein] reductase
MDATYTTQEIQMTDRIAIVTGASGGIGHAVAVRLAQAGMAVAVHYSGNHDHAEAVADEIVGAGGRAIVVSADFADEAQVAALFDEVEAEFGGVDVVVNTAGITNVRGTFVVSQQAARRVRKGGAIINFSTSVTKLAAPSYSAYAATKGAVDAMTLILAKEMRGHDVTVNAVAPGPTATPLYFEGKSQEVIDRAKAASPLGRLGEPNDIAEAVAFLAGPARWINSQVIYANGGVI